MIACFGLHTLAAADRYNRTDQHKRQERTHHNHKGEICWYTFSHFSHVVCAFGLGTGVAGALIEARLRVRTAVPERARPAAIACVLAIIALGTLESPVPRVEGIRPTVAIFPR